MFHRMLAPTAVALFGLIAATPAHAQVLGTFKWQTLPFCNVVTLTITQQGSMYQLNGSDDVCAGGSAPATGTALVTAGGLGMGVTIVLPSGRAAHLTTTVNVATGNGTWNDADGNGGTFLLASGPAGPGPSPRPAPMSAAVITAAQLSPTIFSGTGAAATVSRSDHTHDTRYYTRAEVDTLLTAAKDDAWGYVIGAAFHASSGNVSVTHPATGQYCLVVSKRTSHKAAQVTLSNPGGNNIVSVGTGHGSLCNSLVTPALDVVPVYVKNPAGAYVDDWFVFYIPAP